MDELPIYGNQPRIKVLNQKGVWQEVEVRVHSLEEIDTAEFWQMVDTAAKSFLEQTGDKEFNIDDHMPWTKLGQKWHFMRKGFTPGKKVHWDTEVLEVLYELLQNTANGAQTLWNNKQVVHLYVPEQKEPWASIQTKKNDAVWLQLTGPKGAAALGRIAAFAREPSVRPLGGNRDVVRLALQSVEEVQDDQLADFLYEHLQAVQA